MSSYSQPLNTISYSQNSLLANQRYKPKYINDSDQDKLNSTIDYQSNKLPLNLFHTAAQYNKMLITYGKNRKKNTSQITDGVITSLEYVNDRIFEKQIQVRAKAKQSIHQSIKQPKKSIDKCTCCCCHEFCQQCANKQHKCSKIQTTDLYKAKQTIDNQIQSVRKGRKVSLNNSIKSKKNNQNKKNSKNQISSRRAHSSIDVQRNQKISSVNQNYLQQSKKSQNKDISHLVIKSLIQFNKKKHTQQMMRLSKLQIQKAKQQYINTLNQSIRKHNLHQSRLSKSKPKQRDLSKNQIATQYWDQVKQRVLQALKNDNYSKTLKNKLFKYDLNVYDHKQLPQRKPRITKQQIQILRKQHQIQAQQQIDKQIQQKLQKKKILNKNLKSLQKQRLNRIRSCQKKPFIPTAQMIQTAFQNIIQPDSKQIITQQKLKANKHSNVRGNNLANNKKVKQIFKNQKIKKSNKI